MLGPPDGRHVLREADAPPSDIVVVVTLGAPERRRLGRRRGRSLPPGAVPEATPVSTSRVTTIDATRPFEDEAAAEGWLATAGDEEVERALLVLDRVVRAHRVARNDPSIRMPRREDAIAVRIGFGTGEQAAEGRLGSGRDVGPLIAPRTGAGRRAGALRPHEHAASVLAGRAPALACEELTLRARADLDARAERLAALGIGLALETALAELAAAPGGPDAAARLGELRELAPGARAAAAAALAGEVPEAELRSATQALERLEAALRARAARL